MKTDLQLYQDIKEKLDFEPGINPHNITYSTHNGVVTINGTVASYAEKQLVKRSVQRIEGVTAIANDLVVKYDVPWTRSDTDIAELAAKVIAWDATLYSKDKIKITVENGRVILSGEVEWYYQALNAVRDIRNLSGVVAVDNQLQIKPHHAIASAVTVKEKIKQEFERHALLDAQNVNVEVAGSTITLKGQVRSWAELKEAAQIAWAVPGVTRVDNQIIIK